MLLSISGEMSFKCPNSSVVEHAAVNRGVTGSSPVWGARDVEFSYYEITFQHPGIEIRSRF